MTEFIDKSAGFIAQHNFECGGRKYTTGDAFDISGLTDRELERLFRYRRIRNVGSAEARKPEPVAAPVPELPAADGVQFVDSGSGWYNVEMGGVVLNDGKIRGLKAAQEWATANGIK